MSTRAQKAEVMKILKEEGKSNKEIADVLGVTSGTVSNYLADPTGARARKNRVRTSIPCKRCGNPLWQKKSKTGLCAKCLALLRHEKRRWTQEMIIKAMKMFEREYGRQPKSVDWLVNTEGGKYPSTSAVQREFGSWDKGIQAAGYQSFKKKSKSVSDLLDELRSLSKFGVAPSTAGKHGRLANALRRQGIDWEEACRLAGVKSRASIRRW